MPSFLACLLSGSVLILAYPKPDLGWLAWFALAPLFWALAREGRAARCVAAALAGGWVFYSGLLYWIDFTCRAGGVSAFWSAAAWLSLSAVLALDWGLVGLILAICKKGHGAFTPGLAGLAWVAVEYLRARWTTQFPWGLLGYTQWRHPLLLQIVSVTGVYGLSFLVAAVNAALGLSARALERPSSLSLSGLARLWTVPILGLGLAWALGSFTLNHLPAAGHALPAALLQPNVDQYRKWDPAFEHDIRSNLESLIGGLDKPGQARPLLVLWPESAVPGWLDERGWGEWVENQVRGSGAFNLVGAVTRSGGKRYNAAFLYSPEGQILGLYRKRRLVPFGEYAPLNGALGRWIPVLGELGAFDAGDAGQGPLPSFLGSFAVGICYEAIFPHLMRNASQTGARFLVNLTNDGWYLDTAGPYQHFAMSVLRAAENRAFLLRAANTGISALVDPYGRVLARSALGTRTALRIEIPMGYANLLPSLYAQAGDVFAGLCLGCVAFLLAASFLPPSWK